MNGEALSFIGMNLLRHTKYGLYLVLQTEQWHLRCEANFNSLFYLKNCDCVVSAGTDPSVYAQEERPWACRDSLGCVPQRSWCCTDSCVSRCQRILMFLGMHLGPDRGHASSAQPRIPLGWGRAEGCHAVEESKASWRCFTTLPGCFCDFNKSSCPQHSPTASSCTFACWPTRRQTIFLCFLELSSVMKPI